MLLLRLAKYTILFIFNVFAKKAEGFRRSEKLDFDPQCVLWKNNMPYGRFNYEKDICRH